MTIVNVERRAERGVGASDAAGWALAHGHSALTTDELADVLGVPPSQVRQRLYPGARRGEWAMPVRGLWVPVPPEYRTWGAPPGIEIIDQMMRHLDIRYYVGWLSAAALHGAAHQAPQHFQVAVNRHVRDRRVGRTKFSFAQREIHSEMTVPFPTRAGSVAVSSIACTLLDIANDTGRAGGIDNAATAIVGLSELEGFRVKEVLALAPHFPASALRRAGWILDRYGGREDLATLKRAARKGAHTPSRLVPSRDPEGPVDRTWLLYLNGSVEPDL